MVKDGITSVDSVRLAGFDPNGSVQMRAIFLVSDLEKPAAISSPYDTFLRCSTVVTFKLRNVLKTLEVSRLSRLSAARRNEGESTAEELLRL